MSDIDYITINKDGVLTAHIWNEDRRDRYFIRDKNDCTEVGPKKAERERLAAAGEPIPEIINYKNDAEGREFFRDIKEVSFEPYYLHVRVKLAEDLTLGDIYRLIESDDFLADLIENLHPYYNCREPENDDPIVLDRVFYHEDGVILQKDDFLGRRSYDDAPVKLGNKIVIVGEKVYSTEQAIDFLEFFRLLFGTMNGGKVYLHKDGLYDEFGAQISKYDIINHLYSECVLDKDIILNDVFKFVESDKYLEGVIGCYASLAIEAFHEEAKRDYMLVMDDWEYKFKRLELTKQLTYDVYESIDTCVTYGIDFFAIAPYEDNPEQACGVEFCKTYALKGIPLVVDDVVEFKEEYNYKPHRTELITKARMPFTLLDILYGIYYEIGFCGNPSNRDSRWDVIADRAYEAKEMLESERPKCKSLDEILKEMDEDEQ